MAPEELESARMAVVVIVLVDGSAPVVLCCFLVKKNMRQPNAGAETQEWPSSRLTNAK